MATYGEKAVGLDFNPSGDSDVHKIKTLYAKLIDFCHNQREREETSGEQKRLYAIAITEAQTAQMWAVKALTFKP